MLKQNFPDWTERTAVILASGHSLTDAQVEHVLVSPHQPKVIAVNSTWQKAPAADVIYAGDFMLWKQSIAGIRKSAFVKKDALWTCDRSAAERFGLNWIKGVNRLGLSRDLRMIHTNGNSGAQAINLAYLFGARKILLLGFDMKLGPNGERHHHPDHPAPLVQSQTFDAWLHKFEYLAKELKEAGCEVINCTTDTALTCFPRSTIEKELT